MGEKIILMGVHGTGKTSALQHLATEGFHAFPEIARELIHEMGRSNPIEYQKELFKRKEHQLIDFIGYHSKAAMDRTILDVLLYSIAFNTPVSEHNIETLLTKIFFQYKSQVKYYYFPLTDKNRNWILNDISRESWEKDHEYIGSFRENLDKEYQKLYEYMKNHDYNIHYWNKTS